MSKFGWVGRVLDGKWRYAAGVWRRRSCRRLQHQGCAGGGRPEVQLLGYTRRNQRLRIPRRLADASRIRRFQAAVDVSYGIVYAGIWGSNIDFAIVAMELGGDRSLWRHQADLGSGHIRSRRDLLLVSGHGNDGAFGQSRLRRAQGRLQLGFALDQESGRPARPSIGRRIIPSRQATSSRSRASRLTRFPQFGNLRRPSAVPTVASTAIAATASASAAPTEDEYKYWNVGLSLAVEKFTFDFRYWDTRHRRRRHERHGAALARASATSASYSRQRSCCPRLATNRPHSANRGPE